jgi:hypothetical protein
VTPRERAWEGVHDSLPPGWRAGRLSYDAGRRTWTVVAIGPRAVKRGIPPDCIAVNVEDETAALTYLAVALQERHRAGRLEELGQRSRLAYVVGAEERSYAEHMRGLSDAEFGRVVKRYPSSR